MSNPAVPAKTNPVWILLLVVVAILTIGVILVIAVAVFGAAFWVVSKPAPMPPHAIPAMTSAQVVPPVINGAAPAEPTKIQSIPDGANVLRDGIIVCQTPCEVSAAEGEELSLEIQLDGYETHKMTITAGGMAGVKLKALGSE